MRVFEVRNVHEALPVALSALEREGADRQSRNGPVIMFEEPVTTVYRQPTERVIFWPERDANPFFHLMESLWMIHGECGLEFPAFFAKQIAEYSDNGATLHGAYGYRWRSAFGKDQLEEVIEALLVDPNTRRQVIQMWDAKLDLGTDSKDLPCNLTITVQVNLRGQLDMMVFSRSNDILWGAYGANAVHFSILQEYIASCVGVPVGRYWQVSSNFHCYKNELWQCCRPIALAEPDPLRKRNPNPYDHVRPYPLFPIRVGGLKPTLDSERRFWNDQLDTFMENWRNVLLNSYPKFASGFFGNVAVPMLRAYTVYKKLGSPEKFKEAKICLEEVYAGDWRKATWEWVDRREQIYLGKQKALEVR